MRDQKQITVFRELDRDIANFYREMYSQKGDRPGIFIPRVEEKPRLNSCLDVLKGRIDELPENDPVFEILKSHYNDFLDIQRGDVKNAYEKPANYVMGLVYTFSNLVRNDSRPDDLKASLLIEYYNQADDVWQAIKTWLPDVSPLYLQAFVGGCAHAINTLKEEAARIPKYFPNLSEAGCRDLEQAVKGVLEALEAWKNHANEIIAKKGLPPTTGTTEDDTIQLDPEYYRQILWDTVGVKLDEILSWYEDEMNKTREEVFSIAGRLNIPEKPKTMQDINDILWKYAGPCDTVEEMFRRGNEYTRRAKDGREGYIWLPEETCIVGEVPEMIKYSFPWGGYNGGCPRQRPLVGMWFLNNHNHKAVSDGWIKMMAIHEAYEGHHVQFIRTTVDPLPETVKRGAKATTITEGTPHRNERVFEFIFEEDPFYPLFVAHRRHHTATRIKVDLTLRYFGKPIKEGCDIYQHELGFDRKTARGQVAAQEDMMGYFTSYYYGMKQLCDWEKKYGIDEKTYTEMLFAAGRISLTNFERFIKLTPEDRNSYLKDFESICEKDAFAAF